MRYYKINPSEHDNICKKYQIGQTSTQIAQEYNVTVQLICYILRKNNIQIRSDKSLNELQEQEVINLYQEGCKVKTLMKQYGVLSSNPILDCLKKYNIPIRTHSDESRIYKINSNFFDVIDNEDKAYFLGLLFADGYNRNSTQISISLKKDDSYILEYLAKQIYINPPKLYTNTEYPTLTICNKEVTQKLENYYGFVQRKSLILKFPDNIPENMMSHFIRGYFDGDGCIFVKHKSPCLQMGFVGSVDFISYLQEFLLEHNIIKSKTKIRFKSNIYDLIITRQTDILSLCQFLYNDATVYLKRKKDNYDKWLQNYNFDNLKHDCTKNGNRKY